jgi:hypothetical protein
MWAQIIELVHIFFPGDRNRVQSSNVDLNKNMTMDNVQKVKNCSRTQKISGPPAWELGARLRTPLGKENM